MHAHERLRALLAATGCTACGGPLEADRIRVLAERDDLAFVELPCASCGSAALAVVTGAGTGEPRVDLAAGDDLAGDDLAGDADGTSSAPPIDEDDVLAMRELLRSHRGDLRSLLGGGDGVPPENRGPG
jgi:hypothetical protein